MEVSELVAQLFERQDRVARSSPIQPTNFHQYHEHRTV